MTGLKLLPKTCKPFQLSSLTFPTGFLQVYVLKRPYVDEFLRRMGELFECVLFTASLAKVSWDRVEGRREKIGASAR